MAFDRQRPDGRLALPPVSRKVGEWTITATWFQDATSDDGGPEEVVLYLPASASAAARRKGMTTGIMKELQGRLAEMTREYHDFVQMAGDDALFEELLDSLKPDTPRASPDYYTRLMGLYEVARRLYPGRHVEVMGDVLDLAKGTLTTRLHVAKRAQRESAA